MHLLPLVQSHGWGVEDVWALKSQTLVSPDILQGVPSLVTLSQ